MVADAKEYLTNHVRLRLGEGWRVDLNELVLEHLALSLDKFFSNELKRFYSHFEGFEE